MAILMKLVAAILGGLLAISLVPPQASAAVYDVCGAVVADPATAFRWSHESTAARDWSNAYESLFSEAQVSYMRVSVTYRCNNVLSLPFFWASFEHAYNWADDHDSQPARDGDGNPIGGCGAVRVTNLATGAYDYIVNLDLDFTIDNNGYFGAYCQVSYGSWTNAVKPGASLEIQFTSLAVLVDWESTEGLGGVVPHADNEVFRAYAPGPNSNARVITGDYAQAVCWEAGPRLLC